MSFFENVLSILIILLILSFLLIKRRQLGIQKIFWPFLYLVVWRSKAVLKPINFFSKLFSKIWPVFIFIGISLSIISMIAFSILLIFQTIKLLLIPDVQPSVQLVLPIKVKGVFFVPFLFWILGVAFVAFTHEFGHAIAARIKKLPLKSAGFGVFSILLPILPLAFVEPDEKKLIRRPLFQQLGIFSAGSFFNFVSAAILIGFALLLGGFISSSVIYKGVKIIEVEKDSPAERANLSVGSVLTKINAIEIKKISDLVRFLKNSSPGDMVTIFSDGKNFTFALGANPKDPRIGWIGAAFEQVWAPKILPKAFIIALIWILSLTTWLYMLSIGIGLFNLLPIGPIDGGRIARSLLEKIFPKSGTRIWVVISLIMLAAIIINIFAAFFR